MTDSTGLTLSGLLQTGDPARPAIVAPGEPPITYDSLGLRIDEVGRHLRSLGIGRGDRVAIVLPNGVDAIVAFLAASSVATAAPLNPSYKEDEFRFYLEDTQAKALITSDQTGDAARNASPQGTLQLTADVAAEGPGVAAGEMQPASHPAPEDVALVLHTSGTTSRPKRVPLTHGNLALSAGNIVDTYQLTDRDVSLCVMPLFHVHGLVASTLSTLLSGGTVVVPSRFNALNFWPMVREHGVTWVSAVPSMHQALLARAERDLGEGDGTGLLRFIRSCSAALPASTMRDMEERFGIPILEAYGMTEASHQMASNPLPPARRYPGAVGFGTGVEIGIMDQGGELLGTGARGEVVIQGPSVIRAYEDNPEANAASFTDGWFRTGDQGYLEENGCLFLVGRIKELINRSGEKISPQEIDDVLLKHPAVAETVAFGVPHPTHGEEPTAAVVLGAEAEEKELIAHCRKHLATFKCPRVIHIVDTIPRTATGKVQRRIVAATIAGERAV